MAEEISKARKEFREEWEWFCSRINFGVSALDARAITFMNEIEKHLDAIEKKSVKGGKKNG